MLLEVARAAVGLALFAWLPGHVWRRTLLPTIGRLAGLVADVILSLALVTLGLFLINGIFGIPISVPTAVWLALALCAIGAAPMMLRGLTRLMGARA